MKYKKTAFIFINFSLVLDLYHTQFPQFHYIKYIRLFEIPRYNEYTLSLYFGDNMTKNVELPISSDLILWKIKYFSFSEVKSQKSDSSKSGLKVDVGARMNFSHEITQLLASISNSICYNLECQQNLKRSENYIDEVCLLCKFLLNTFFDNFFFWIQHKMELSLQAKM